MSKLTEHEKEIRALNQLLLEQKDQINALAAERDTYKATLKEVLLLLTGFFEKPKKKLPRPKPPRP